MPDDDLFADEEQVIATGEQLVAAGGFKSPDDKQHYEQLLKSYDSNLYLADAHVHDNQVFGSSRPFSVTNSGVVYTEDANNWSQP